MAPVDDADVLDIGANSCKPVSNVLKVGGGGHSSNSGNTRLLHEKAGKSKAVIRDAAAHWLNKSKLHRTMDERNT